jgi:poly(3-hydroxybutyrate) depolymerase
MIGLILTIALLLYIDSTLGAASSGLQTPLILEDRISGCGEPLPDGVSIGKPSNQTIISGGLNRTYRIHAPDSYQTSTPAPLILSFHGRHRNATEQERLSDFSNASYNPSAIAVYPQGEFSPDKRDIRQWQGDPDASQTINDVRFVLDLISDLKTKYCIASHQVYAAGKSNGGGLVNLLACDPEASSVIAAFAPVSAAIYLNADGNFYCNPTSSRDVIPILETHGFLDRTIFYNGSSPRGKTVDIPDWIDWWAQRNGCSPSQNRTRLLCTNIDEKPAIEYWWDCKDITDAVVHYNISNLKHQWPSKLSNDDGIITTCFDATTKIMEFFAKHRLT